MGGPAAPGLHPGDGGDLPVAAYAEPSLERRAGHTYVPAPYATADADGSQVPTGDGRPERSR